VQAAVDFEAITAVPVAAFVYESAKGRCSIMKRGQEGRARGKYALFGFGKMGSDEFMIPKEKADPDESKHDIDSRAQSRCLLQSQQLRFHRAILIQPKQSNNQFTDSKLKF
jgi:hypothetical protein